MKFCLSLIIIFLSHSFKLFAWLYPEHRDIALMAVENLSQENRSIFDKLWQEARKGYESRLTESVIDNTQTINPAYLDFASWPAIAGDHSCSPDNMLFIILKTDWILKVADAAAQLKIDISNSKKRSEHVNAIRDSDIKLQRVDPEYATRAGSNNVHFLLARPDVNTDLSQYLIACLQEGAELNAIGAYTWFHISALTKAVRYANEKLTTDEKSALILSALADEAFALHFLEDSFASGHTAGTWGDVSQRKGTHDYYNERGLEVVTWNGERMILMGDAYMRTQDAELAAKYARVSLEQLIDAASGKIKFDYETDDLSSMNTPDTLNVCSNNFMPGRKVDKNVIGLLHKVLDNTPVPGLATGHGELPRFRTEIGPFIGIVSSLRGSGLNGGFGKSQVNPGALSGLDVTIRLGFGIEGVLSEAGDGLVFLDVGWRQDGASTMKFGDSPELAEGGGITSAIPGRDALNMRLRMPFYIFPFDLLITAPFLIWASPETFANMAVVAGNGGLIPWQAGIATSIGRFQFILGREVGIAIYGEGENKDDILVPVNDITNLIRVKSVQLDFPVIEYKPFRTFSSDQSSSLAAQLNFGVDIPYGYSVIETQGSETPDLKTIWYAGLRIVFDWRYYF